MGSCIFGRNSYHGGFQGRIQLCLKCILLLCCKYRLYNTGSAQLLVLCTSLVPHNFPMCALCWGFNELWTWCLVVPKVFCWRQNFPPSLLALKSLGYVLKAWACSAWYVLDLGFCPICALGTSCQYHLDIRKNHSPMSWYKYSPIYFVRVRWCQLVVYMVLSVKILYRPHCLAGDFLVENLFLLGNCLVWSGLL